MAERTQKTKTQSLYTHGSYSYHMVDKTTDNKSRIVNLYLSDYGTKHHAREMARLLKKSHVTLLPHLKSLEKDKIFIAKTTGKNKIYTLNLENIIAKNYIMSAEIAQSTKFLESIFLMKKIATDIFKLKLPGTIILFGSYAKHTFRADSDIDLFYLGAITGKEIQDIRKIGKIYGKIINVKKSAMENFENSLRKKDTLIIEIMKNHIILQNPEPFINAMWRYYDEKR